jgi:glycosyltransferase involved in cell wall biosynthesis
MIKAISVVIPSYNASAWLPKTIPKIDEALVNSGVKNAEIIVIDDGSTDNTESVVSTIKTSYPIRYYHFENGGRFLARKRGVEKAKYEYLLFIDTRIFIAPKGLEFVVKTQASEPERQVWTSHVHLDKQGNMYARFWEAITFVAWRKYFKNPRDLSYGIKNFDSYPKGTTCFFTPKAAIIEANEWFEKNTKDVEVSNDDTLLIRRIAEKQNININPQFYCTYHARTNLRNFVKHVHHRGKVFVDGFLRRDGNKLFYPLVVFLVLSVVVPIVLLINLEFIKWFLVLAFSIWVGVSLLFFMVGVHWRDAISFFVLSPLFLVSYGLGIWKAFLKIHVRPKVFGK